MAPVVKLTIRGDIDPAVDAMAVLSNKRWHRAVNTAVNQTGRQTLTHAARLVAKDSGLKARDSKKEFKLEKSKPATLTATVVAGGRPVPLIEFGGRQTKRGASAKAWGNRKLYPSTFIATAAKGQRKGKDTIFARKAERGLPVKQLFGPGVAQTLASQKITGAVREYAGQRLQTNIGRQIQRAIARMEGFA